MAADLGAAPAAPPASAMVSDNEINFGLGGIWGTNTGQAGRYTGFTEEGLDGLFSFKSVTRDAWNSGGTRYYIIEGSDINFQFGDNLGTANVPAYSSANPALVGTTGGTAQSNLVGTGVNSQIVNSQIRNFKDGNYTSQTANDLGPNASLGFKVGDQGHWGVIGYYDAISYTGNIIDSIYTINGHTGSLNPGLTQWGGATLGAAGPIVAYNALVGGVPSVSNSTVNAAFPLGAEQPFQMGTRRDIVGLTGKYTWGDWTITGALRHEHKEGSVEESFDGAYGGTAFALPIDYDTERYDLSAAYSTPQIQAVFGYFLSNFTDNNNAVSLPDPLSGTAKPFEMTALYATPPSNLAQYVTAAIGYNLMPGTRFNLNARYGVETQNDTFPANTGDPALTAGGPPGGFALLNSSGQGTGNATSPNITAEVFQGNVGVSTNPIAGLNASAKYSIDERDVQIGNFGVAGCAGGGNCVIGSGSGSDSSITGIAGYVVPQEWLKQKVNLDADYRILPQSNTKLTVGYEYDNINRSNAQVGHSDTNIGTIGLSSMFGSALMGRITASYGDRSGVLDYWTAWQNLATGNGNFAAGTPSGAYYQAPMTLASVNLRADYAPAGPFSGGVSFKAENDDFHYPSTTAGTPAGTLPVNLANQDYGIKSDYNLTAGIDANYRPVEGVNFHAYYTYEQIFYNNLGNGACADSAAAPLCTGSAGYFQNKYTNDVQTVGLSTEWQATDKLKLSAEYTFAYGAVMFGEYDGVFVPLGAVTQTYQNVSNYPDDHSIMNALTLKASYKLTDNIELSLGGMYSMFWDKDWRDLTGAVVPDCPAGGGCTAAQQNTVAILTPGYASPNYNVGAVMAMLKVKW
jgi:MtrB/PioB family decaheme-associated outer membrane protein